jgi:hypothetical protein
MPALKISSSHFPESERASAPPVGECSGQNVVMKAGRRDSATTSLT